MPFTWLDESGCSRQQVIAPQTVRAKKHDQTGRKTGFSVGVWNFEMFPFLSNTSDRRWNPRRSFFSIGNLF